MNALDEQDRCYLPDGSYRQYFPDGTFYTIRPGDPAEEREDSPESPSDEEPVGAQPKAKARAAAAAQASANPNVEPDGSYKHYLPDGSFIRIYPDAPADDDESSYSYSSDESPLPNRQQQLQQRQLQQQQMLQQQQEALQIQLMNLDPETRKWMEEQEAAKRAENEEQSKMLKEMVAKMEEEKKAEAAIEAEKEKKRKERIDALERQAFQATQIKRTEFGRKKKSAKSEKQEQDHLAALLKDIQMEAGVDANAPPTKPTPAPAAGVSSILSSINRNAVRHMASTASQSNATAIAQQAAAEFKITEDDVPSKRPYDDLDERPAQRRRMDELPPRREPRRYDAGDGRRRRDKGYDRDFADDERPVDRPRRRNRDDPDYVPRERRRADGEPRERRRRRAAEDIPPIEGSAPGHSASPVRSKLRREKKEPKEKKEGEKSSSSSPEAKRSIPMPSSGFDKSDMPPEHAEVRARQMAANPVATVPGVGIQMGAPKPGQHINTITLPDGTPVPTSGLISNLQNNAFRNPGYRPALNPFMAGVRRPINPGPMLPGDWVCPTCGDHVFAKNYACRFCGAGRPVRSY